MKNIVLIVAVLLLSNLAHAQDSFPAQARLFAGLTWANHETLNQEMRSNGLKEFGPLGKVGVEITYALTSFLDIGISYSWCNLEFDETELVSSTNYAANLTQTMGLAVARVPFLRSNYFRADAFAGIGGANTSLKMVTATQNGEYHRKDSAEFFATIVSRYGFSGGVGYKKFYFYVEAGYESNKIDSLKTSGTVSGNINSLNFSGGYGMIGLMFDGVTARKQ